SIPPSIHLEITELRTTMIRASVRDVEPTLLLSVFMVILVVFFFLGSAWATFIPSVVVPMSLVGTFGVMYLVGYSIDNLSLMALTISTGFVVDDAIVVIENISRYLEQGLVALEAACRCSRQGQSIQPALPRICDQSPLGIATPAPGAGHHAGNTLPGDLSLRCDSQRLLPAAGHGAHQRLRPGQRGHFFPNHAAKGKGIRGDS